MNPKYALTPYVDFLHAKQRKRRITTIALTVLVMAGAFLLPFAWYYSNHSHDNTGALFDETSVTAVAEPTQTPIPTATPQEEQLPVTNLAEALAVNGDTVAWITINNSYISEPVLQAGDNLVYLRQDIYMDYNTGGSIFADYECDFTSRTTSQNLIIYGHSWTTSDNKGFSQLRSYLEEDGVFFAEHPLIAVELTDGTVLHYQVVSAGIADAEQDGVCIVADPTLEQLAQIEALAQERNVLDTDFTLTEDTQFLTLSTCTGNDEERLLILAIFKPEL